MDLPWNNQEKEQPAEQPVVPEPEKKKNQIIISQSLIKKVIDKNGNDIPLCPHQLYKNYLADDKIKPLATIPMKYGNYGESLILGATAKDEEISLPTLNNGKKPIDQIRIEQQALEYFPRHAMELGISVIKNTNVQIPIYKEYGGLIIRGVIDLFPTPIIEESGYRLAVIDIKLTGDVNNTHGDFCWGNPQWMDHIQADLYQWILADIDVDLCKRMDPEFDVRVGYDSIFTPHILNLLKARLFSFYYIVMGYQKSNLKEQFIKIKKEFFERPDYVFLEKELKERIRKTIARLAMLNQQGWKPEPEYNRCKNCSVSKLNGGTCIYYTSTRVV
jgi:hypothetical protein